jgi:hypothetical protein
LISDDQLRVAQGKVRCSKCHKVFNALESLQKPPQTTTAPIKGQQPEKLPESVTDFMSEDDLAEFAELKAKISDDLNPDKEDSLEPETSAPKQETEQKIDKDLSDVLKELERMENQSREDTDAPEETTAILEPEPLLEAEVGKSDDSPKPPPSSKATIHDPMELLAPKKPPKKRGGFLWAVGILLLLAIALAQLAWFKRDQLMHYPEGRVALQTACKYVGCSLPTIRAPEKIQVLSRSITMHPKIENALLIQLTIANKANFPQPQPLLQISLFSSEEMLVVQRRFKPSEYLAKNAKHGPLLPGKAMYVELAIEDPGNDVTGFKLDFF